MALTPDPTLPPTLPRWLAQAFEERGARLSVAVDAPAKARHGRYERRIVWALADPAQNARVGDTGTVGQPWPHVQQLCRIERRRICQRTGETATVVGYAITSRPAAKADAHALAAFTRGHWGIENRLHYVRDGAFDEDRSRVRTGAAPEAFAACRNLALGVLRLRRVANVAAALRSCAWRPRLAVRLVLTAATKR